ncbi:MAG: hypothetical protein K8F24_05900, partial [Bacteroidales bacterium]|nr:hypothetical protein [Bacteroidales bacterium]
MNTVKYILTSLQILAAMLSFAQQTTWEYVLRTPDIDEETIDLVEGNDGSIYVGGRTIILDQQYNYKSILLKIDPQGTFVDSVHFTLTGKWTSLSQILPVSNDKYVVLSTFRDLSPPHKNCGLQMQMMNENLEVTTQNMIFADSSYRLTGSWGSYSNSDEKLFIN